MLNSWKDELEGFMASARERTPTELINGIRDIGVAMGHEAGEALLDSHPELFAHRPMLTRAFIEMVHAQDVAEIRQMLELKHPTSFGQIAAEETTIGVMSSKDAYKRLDEVFEHVDFSRCTRAVMVGCGGRPFTMFRICDQTPVPEIVGLDIVPEAVETANILAAKLGYIRMRAEFRNGRDYDYRGAQLVYIASMVSPKAAVVSRVADTAPPDLQLVLWEPYSLARLWSERAEETLDPRLEVVGRTRVSRNMTRDVFVRFWPGAAGRGSAG
ncbi:class I SAM-dependent methyltransferase [Mesorhizobium sp. CA16]|uniref:class I SAM-dependent methyltransferase n=1 Tax=Mesorhizobium sp. CA16 TaxID=588496 RepID=UPI001CCF4AEE|nr:class I SAM-dependent methyltransferase [Mesorhizobium sp. CA16]MBZ9912035.1 class I SAM-dependent methyltransferase [Mesorhizobium sp. CA16]